MINTKKYIPYIIIAVLLVGAVAFVSNKFKTTPSQNTQTAERVPSGVNLGASPKPVSEINLDNKAAVQSGIDSELRWIDQENAAVNKIDLSGTVLSDQELGL